MEYIKKEIEPWGSVCRPQSNLEKQKMGQETMFWLRNKRSIGSIWLYVTKIWKYSKKLGRSQAIPMLSNAPQMKEKDNKEKGQSPII
jgi:hypothetical protein